MKREKVEQQRKGKGERETKDKSNYFYRWICNAHEEESQLQNRQINRRDELHSVIIK